MSWLYLDETLDPADGSTQIDFSGAEAKHAVTVNRTRVGDTVTVGNGAGFWVTGTVASAEPQRVVIDVDSRETFPKPDRSVTLVQALAKGGRDEMAVQAATELGVDAVVPWAAARSVSKWEGAAKVAKGVARWQSIAREAGKQSIRPWSVSVSDPVTSKQLCALASDMAVLVLEPSATVSLSEWGRDSLPGESRDLALVVGPEGGIAPQELAQLADSGAVILRLGSGVLRTSTAGPAALSALSLLLGRW